MSTSRRPWTELSEAELRTELDENHIWVNAISTIRPSDEFLLELGRTVLAKLRETELGDAWGISATALIRINAS